MQKPNITDYEGKFSPSLYHRVYDGLIDASGEEPVENNDKGVSSFEFTGGLRVELSCDLYHVKVRVQRWGEPMPEKIKKILETAGLKEVKRFSELSLEDLTAGNGLTGAFA